MRTNPFYDAWLFLIGRTGDHENSGAGWLLTILFIALLLASIWIARRNWQEDAAQRTGKHLAIWFMRVMIGAMWFQVHCGSCRCRCREALQVGPRRWGMPPHSVSIGG